MTEEWKTIEHTGDCQYEVSNTGRVRVSPTTTYSRQVRFAGREMHTSVNNAGYKVCWLCLDGKARIRLIHRLVADAFCEGSAKTVNHKDGDKLNNAARNLEWMSHSANIEHAIDSGLYKRKLTREDRDTIRRMYFEDRKTQKEIAGQFGVTDVLVSKLLTGDTYARDNAQTRTKGRGLNINRIW